MTTECGFFGGRVGDRGQRYEVFYIDGLGQECSAGWSGSPDGGGLTSMIEAHPGWRLSRIVDRKNTRVEMDNFNIGVTSNSGDMLRLATQICLHHCPGSKAKGYSEEDGLLIFYWSDFKGATKLPVAADCEMLTGII